MKASVSKRRLAVAAAVVLILFLLRPGASPLKSRIITSISAAVGRPVDIGSVHIRLLPRPGFDLNNLVVYDDPAFGAEPILRAGEVTAVVRLTSLLRGRLEIARLDLTEPSLNLVHSNNGWNLEALLERTLHIPLAPTAKAKSEPRPAFPYIEASSARINFKNGAEKTPFALTNADFSLWQGSENAWGVRLKAQPFRGDQNLNDIGQLRLNGSWQRAERFLDTPLQVSVEWSRAQLGQVTKFFTGSDKGWRGSIQIDATLSGTPSKLRMSSTGSIDDFRRYDITSGNALRLAGHCDGNYSSLTHEFHEVICSAPVGQGLIMLTGDMGLPGSDRYAVIVRAENVPAKAAVTLAERAKKNLPDDLATQGTLQGSFLMQNGPDGSRFEGSGQAADFWLESAENRVQIGPQTVPFLLVSGGADSRDLAIRRLGRVDQPRLNPRGVCLEFGPFSLRAGRAGSAAGRGWISGSGYNLTVVGDTDVSRALGLARMIGLPALPTNVEGDAQVNLQIAGAWAGLGSGPGEGFGAPQVSGDAKLRNVRVAPRGLGSPVEIASADLQLLADEVRVSKLKAKAAGASWNGSMEMPRSCGRPDACEIHFALNTSQVALARLTEWASPGSKKRPWYRMLEPGADAGPSFFASLRASGRITADHLQIHDLVSTHAVAHVTLGKGKLQITEMTANFMGGQYRGEWEADFSAKPAVCHGGGSFTGVSLAGLAQEMKDKWVAGTANASYEVKGSCPADFWQSAEGTLKLNLRNAVLPHVSVGDEKGPFQVSHLLGQAQLHAGKIEMKNVSLDSPQGKYRLSGTASLKRDIDLKLERIRGNATVASYAITGTVSEPRVTPLTRAVQARLKTPPAK